MSGTGRDGRTGAGLLLSPSTTTEDEDEEEGVVDDIEVGRSVEEVVEGRRTL